MCSDPSVLLLVVSAAVLHGQLDRQTRSYELLRLLADPTPDVRIRALTLVLEGQIDPNLALLMLPTAKRIAGETTAAPAAAAAAGTTTTTTTPPADSVVLSFDTLSDEQLQSILDAASAESPGADGGGAASKRRSTSSGGIDRKISLSRPPSYVLHHLSSRLELEA